MLVLSAAAAAAGTTWNPGDNSDATLSNGNLTASFQTTANTWRGVRATNPKSTGKLHAEITITALDGNTPAAGCIVGIGDSTASLTSYCGSDVHAVGFEPNNGSPSPSYVIQNGSFGVTFNGAAPTVVGDVLAIEIDIANKLVWFQNVTRSGGWTGTGSSFNGNPGAGTGGFAFSATLPIMLICSGNFNGSADTMVLNIGGTAFSGTVSSGFSAWG